jgi:hypothetical protein
MAADRLRGPRRPIPKDVQEAVLARAGNACERCGARENLRFHHIRQHDAAGLLIFGYERAGDLLLLCKGGCWE